MKKFFIYLFAFVLIGTFITMFSLTFADNLIYSINNSSVIIETSNSLQDLSSENIKLDNDAESAQYAYNNKYYMYLKDNRIYIHDTKTKEVTDVIDDQNNICFYNLLYDKNLIIYFTEKKVGSSSKLTIKTYEISSKSKMEYNEFTVYNFSRIKELEASPVINVKYINIETKSGSKINNIIYRVDLFNSMAQVKSGTIIEKLVMLKQKDRLYYETDKGDIYYSGGKLNIFKEKVHLIGTDLNDNIYFISQDSKDKVYKVDNNKIVDTIQLFDTDVVTWYSDNTNVYLVYPTYIINVSSDEPHKRLIRLSNYVTFETIKTDTVYLRSKDNIIVTKQLAE